MLQFTKPVPVIVEDNREGYALYVTDSGMLENDLWCVVLCEGGVVRHYRSDQIRIHFNATFDIKPIDDGTQPKQEKADGQIEIVYTAD